MRVSQSFLSCLFAILVMAAGQPSQLLAQTNTIYAYPNSTEGLRKLLNDVLLSAKGGDQKKLRAQIVDMEIPDYENWFIHMFGPDKGASWAGPYGKDLAEQEKNFQQLWIELANQKGEIVVVQVDTVKKYDTLTGPLDEYIATWKKSEATNGRSTEPIGPFYFVDGKFRWDSTVRYPRDFSPIKGSVVAAKLIEKVQPVYPPEAREKRIEGTVVLNVVITKDGSVTVLSAKEGDPLLVPAAIDAVQHWRYTPFLLNGAAVDMRTQIHVVFALTQPH
jgi:TonB family protein